MYIEKLNTVLSTSLPPQITMAKDLNPRAFFYALFILKVKRVHQVDLKEFSA